MSSSPSFSFGALLRRPETGSFLGLVAVFLFFTAFGGTNFASPTGAASWLNVAAQLGIVAIPIGLLMIAGELDISIGSIIPAGSMTCAIISGYYGLPIWIGVGAALALGAVIGLINGILVIRTAVPSFIVTLGTLFAVAGMTLGFSVLVTGTTSVAIKVPEAKWLLGDFIAGIYQVTIFWWIAAALFWSFVLHASPLGNWIFAMGGDKAPGEIVAGAVRARDELGRPLGRTGRRSSRRWCHQGRRRRHRCRPPRRPARSSRARTRCCTRPCARTAPRSRRPHRSAG